MGYETAATVQEVPGKFAALLDGMRSQPGIPAFLFGVLLPLAAFVTEIGWHLCGGAFFDPLPTLLHTLLVGSVPIANLALMHCLRSGKLGRMRLLAWVNGAVIGVCAFYALIFLPLFPLGVIGILACGLGLFLLAPALALAASIGLRRHLAQGGPRLPGGLWAGFACAVGLLLLSEAPSALTRWGMRMAASADKDTHVRGVRLLRAAGDEAVMLKLCYAWPTRATDLTGFLLSLGEPVGTAQARTVFYQVRGVTFNSLPAPKQDGRGWFDFERFDGEQGGNAVAGKIPGLALSASRIDASIDAQAALSYQEWTLEFANAGSVAAEARAQIELPPDGVVSRLTLWVNGEEREAAFASRGRTRAAYESVVRARRDPVLVTSLGKDRVLMQCFPVPAGGGRMKVRLGITAPLSFAASGDAHFNLPRFAERNFGTGEGGADAKRGDAGGIHSIWLEATEPFPSPAGEWALGNEGDTHTLRGPRPDAWLSQGQTFVVGGSGGNHAAWTEDPAGSGKPGGGKSVIRQWTESSLRAPLGKLTLVVDGSKGMRPYLDGICGAIRRSNRPMRVVLAASEEIREFQGSAQEAGNWLEHQPCVGGQDNAAALQRGWDAADRDGAVLWIAAAAPELAAPIAGLRQRLERGAAGPRLLAVQVENGPNRLLEGLLDGPESLPVAVLRFSGPLQEELESLLSPSPVTRMVLVRKRSAAGSGPEAGRGEGKRTSDHLARLWAHDEITAWLAKGSANALEEATAMASAYRLVTPVSGAVVLENDAQYAAAGLEPGASATVPGVPEPETVWLVLIVALALLARSKPWRYLKPRRAAA